MSKRKEPENYFDAVSEKGQAYDSYTAACVIYSMRFAKLDQETADTLQAMTASLSPPERPAMHGPEHQARNIKPSSSSMSRALPEFSLSPRLKPLAKSKPEHQAVKKTRDKPELKHQSWAQPEVPDQLPEFGYSIDGTKLPKLPPMENLRGMIGNCSEPFEKQITRSDTNGGQSRIAVNKLFVEKHYLPMLYRNENVVEGIRVTVYGPNGKDYGMTFKFWSGKNYVLNSGWNEFVKDYGLKPFTYWTTIRMFRNRQSDRLCFALNWTINLNTTTLITNRRRGKGHKSLIVEDDDD